MIPMEIINKLLESYKTSREFARVIGEDAADITRWKFGRCQIKPRAVINICRHHPDLSPHDLNPDVFPADLKFNFGEPTNE